MARTDYINSTPPFIVDHGTVGRINGRQIDWANVAVGYINAATGKKVLPAGTIVGDTLDGTGSRDAVSPRVVTTNPAMGILETTAVEGDTEAAKTGYGIIVGGAIYGNLLPGGMPAAPVKAELATNSVGFHWSTYSDTRL